MRAVTGAAGTWTQDGSSASGSSVAPRPVGTRTNALQGGLEVGDLPQDGGELLDVAGGHRGVDLQAEAQLAHGAGRDQRLVEDVPDLAEPVVGGRCRAVERERHRHGAGVSELAEHVGREAWRHRGRQRHGELAARPVRDELDQVGPLERLAAGEDDDGARRPQVGQVVEQRATLLGAQLERAAVGNGVRPAVAAHQLAGARDPPDDEERSVVEVVAQRPDRVAAHQPPSPTVARWWTCCAAPSPERMQAATPSPS